MVIGGYDMNWKALWLSLFGTTEWAGINIGFWMGLVAVLTIACALVCFAWSAKPKQK